jgi:hypothetical protein
MMPQAWFEMAEIRHRKFAVAAWIPLRAVQRICEEGKCGHLEFKEEFFGVGSLVVPIAMKGKAERLGWSDVGISHEHRACVDDGRYIPSDAYEYSRGEQIGISLVLEQRLTGAEHNVWHLHQDFVIALELMRDGDRWICPKEGYTEVARIHRHPDGRPFLIEVKAEFLLDYLCARGMGLLVTAYRSREEVVGDIAHINWAENPKHEGPENARWEGRTYDIHEGGMPFGAETATFHVSRTDVDPSEDVPVFGFPADEVTEGRVWAFKHEERKLFVVKGEYWRDEWINPGKYSVRIRGDDAPGSVFFITDAAGTRESKETLTKEGRWLWFRAEVINALLEYRGGYLCWHTRDTGSATCSPDCGVHFGVNSIGLVNVYAKDIGLLPDWQQRVWGGFNVTPEGGVSEELLASQMRAQPADTTAPESALVQALDRMDEVFLAAWGKPLFREHACRNEVLNHIHRFRSISEKGLFALAKDIARLTADSIDIVALHEITAPPKGEKWGSLKSLEKVLATVCTPEEARCALTPLVGAYQLRLADAHLPGNELAEAMKLAGIDGIASNLGQGRSLISNCADTAFKIASLLEKLPVVVGSVEKND